MKYHWCCGWYAAVFGAAAYYTVFIVVCLWLGQKDKTQCKNEFCSTVFQTKLAQRPVSQCGQGGHPSAQELLELHGTFRNPSLPSYCTRQSECENKWSPRCIQYQLVMHTHYSDLVYNYTHYLQVITMHTWRPPLICALLYHSQLLAFVREYSLKC